MARKTRTHVVGDAPTEPQFLPRHLTKQQFGARLYKLMLKKGWRQSELARRADIPRDSISTYVRGQALPGPLNVQKLAQALGVKPEELLPNHVEMAIDEDMPSLSIQASTNAPNTAWLRINRLVETSTALKIAEILANDKALERAGGS